MKAEILRMGVPPEAVLLEPHSTTTHENLLFAAPLIRARGWRGVLLITSASHMGRAERVARRTVPEVEWLPVPVPDAGPWSRIYKQRHAKLAYYLARGWA